MPIMTHGSAPPAGSTFSTPVAHELALNCAGTATKYNSASNASLHWHFSTHPSRTTRPLRFFHPTSAEFIRQASGDGTPDVRPSSHWSSRASRKNRYSSAMVHVRRSHEDENKREKSTRSPSLVVVEQRLRHPHTRLKAHITLDISFWVALAFVLGSSAWVSYAHFIEGDA